MKIQKKLSQNKNGANAWSTLLIIIVIGLIAWQFGAGYLGINSLSDYLAESDIPDGDISFSFHLENPSSHNLIPVNDILSLDIDDNDKYQDFNEYYIEENENIPSLIFETNAPTDFSNPYYVRILYQQFDYTLLDNAYFKTNQVIVYEKSFSNVGDLWTEKYDYTFAGLRTDSMIDYPIESNYLEIYFYSPSDTVLFSDYFLITIDGGIW